MTEEIKQKIIVLANEGKSNANMCAILQVKDATLQSWKRKIRAEGIFIPSILGRPKLGDDRTTRGIVMD